MRRPFLCLVLPERFELSTSPFIPPPLSRPPMGFAIWTIPSPWAHRR